jgi:hypothetical protein
VLGERDVCHLTVYGMDVKLRGDRRLCSFLLAPTLIRRFFRRVKQFRQDIDYLEFW